MKRFGSFLLGAAGAAQGSLAVRLASFLFALTLATQAGAVIKNQPPASGGGGSGSVTSVQATAVSPLCVTGGPITVSGTLAFTWCASLTANQFLATPDGTTGAVSLRAIVVADLPTVNSNVGSFTNASVTVNAQGLVTAVSSGAAPAAGANPTGTVGLAAVNGSATTFLRSDGAPALSQSIVPTWTGAHTFSATPVMNAGLTLSNAANAYTQTSTGLSSTSGTTGFGRNITGTVNNASVVDGVIDFANITCTACAAGTLLVDWQVGGVSAFSVDPTGNLSTMAGGLLASGGSIRASGAGSFQFSGRALLTSPAAATMQLGTSNGASPVSQTLRVQGTTAASSNTAGGNFTIQSGVGTGNATGSTISLQVPAATTSGTTLQTNFTELQLSATGNSVGDTTNNPTFSVLGNGAMTVGGTLAVTGSFSGSGSVTGARLTVNGATLPSNGMYLPSANTVGFAANLTQIGTWNTTAFQALNGVLLPGLASSSSATTGTLCWTTGTGNVTVDTTVACLASLGAWKEQIENLEDSLDEIMKLRPVSYQLKPEFNPEHLGRQVGFLAEDVEKIDTRLVGYGGDGKLRGVRYMQLTALLAEGEKELNAKIQRQQLEILGLGVWCMVLTGFLIYRRR